VYPKAMCSKGNLAISCDLLLGLVRPTETFDTVTRQSCRPDELPRDSAFWQGTAFVQDPATCVQARRHVLHRLVLGTAALSWHSTRGTVKIKQNNIILII